MRKILTSTRSQAGSASAADPRWTMLVSRKASRDAFVYAVRTTGVFCRPGCASRLPDIRNVVFFSSTAEAVAAGFRPCKRCQPLGPHWQDELDCRIIKACRRLEESDSPVSLGSLAQTCNLSRFHFQRVFKARLGLTPKEYHALHRFNRFKASLRQTANVTAAVYRAGFASSSRAYERVSEKLGMTPRQYLKGGEGEVISFSIQPSSLGAVLIALSTRGVCAVELGAGRPELVAELKTSFPRATLREDAQLLGGHMLQLLKHIGAPQTPLGFPLDIRGSVFQQRVWKALQRIPPGETRSYPEVARQIGRPRAIRAVARACAANKLAVLVPCHRVRRSDGGPGGYRWGLKRKQLLLKRELR